MRKLFVAGCGIKFLSHVTYEVQSLIRQCDCVVYLVNDPATKHWLSENSKRSISLDPIYFGSDQRSDAYDLSCKEIIKIADKNENTCFISYGNPMFLSTLCTKLVDMVEKLNNISLEILPGVSSLDTLFCDLRVDPVKGGLQAYEATEFIAKDHTASNKNHLILWQIGVAGISKIISDDKELEVSIERKKYIILLKEKLLKLYDKNHIITLYVASMFPSIPFTRIDIPMSSLDKVKIPRLSTGYIAPYSD